MKTTMQGIIRSISKVKRRATKCGIEGGCSIISSSCNDFTRKLQEKKKSKENVYNDSDARKKMWCNE